MNLASTAFLSVAAALGVALFPSPAAPASVASVPAARAAAETYKPDPAHSSVVFHTKHLGISRLYGRFGKVSEEKSKLVYDKTDPTKSSVLLVIDATSIDTGNAERDQHVRGTEFFSVKEFPEIVFESQKVTAKGDMLAITGELTLHGVSKEITVQAQKIGEGDVAMFQDYRAGFLAEFTIDMRDFGIEFVKKNPTAVGPEVSITVCLECVRGK
jgi:polyisoprenoid-binding protein YceI